MPLEFEIFTASLVIQILTIDDFKSVLGHAFKVNNIVNFNSVRRDTLYCIVAIFFYV